MNQHFTRDQLNTQQILFFSYTVEQKGNMTAQDSYEYSTNTGAKLSVGKNNEQETDPQGEHNPGNRCSTLTITTEPGGW